MKATALITLLFITTFSYAQQDFTGEWYSVDSNSDTPIGFVFNHKSECNILELGNQDTEVYQIIPAHYYYEDGSDLLVTIVWYQNEAMTIKYKYSFNAEGNLVLEQTYPQHLTTVYKREGNLANL